MDASNLQEIQENINLHDGDIIGSSANCKIRLPSTQIASQHAKIQIHNDVASMSTLDSMNKFCINGEEVENAVLSHGDIVNIGDYTFLYNDDTTEIQNSNAIDDTLEAKIESRLQYYKNTKHILDTLHVRNKTERRLSILYKVANTLSESRELKSLINSLLQILLSEFSADRAIIVLYDSSREKLTAAGGLSQAGEIINPKVSGSIVREVFQTKESLLCENIMNDERFNAQESIISYNILSVICAPLIRNKEILGIIQLDSHIRGKFKTDDLELLTQIALQASIVLENAQYYQAKQLFQQNLLAVSDATKKISSYLCQDLILQDATYYAAQIFNTSRCFLFLQENNTLKIASANGIEKEKIRTIPIPHTIKNILKNNQPILYQKYENMPDDLKQIANNKDSLLAVPIWNNTSNVPPMENTIGVLCIINRINAPSYNEEDTRLLSILADCIAIALSNAYFYEEIKQKEKEIAEWNQELEKRVQERTEEFEKVQQKLVQTEKMAAVGLLASGISHEFNNIFASMYGFAQIALKNEKYKEKLVNIVIEQSKRACEITERLVTFSKQKGETMEFINLHDVLENVLTLTEPALHNEGVEIIKNYFPELPKTYLNVGKIQQLFMNVLINACHSIEKKGTITISTTLTEDKQWIHISFQDTGQGIEPEKLDKIFEPFYTTKGSFGGGNLPGQGIGLTLCYNIAKQHGGDINVTSKVGLGSNFTVILPVTTTVTVQSSMKKENIKFQGVPQSSLEKRALIIENIESVQDLLAYVLEDRGWTARKVQDPIEAIEFCKKEEYAYIFLDVQHTEQSNQLNIFDKIKQLVPSAKIILITGQAVDATLMKYVGQADGYLRKPFDIEDIYRVFDK
jgi:signal transduction histidine kinase/putative methionine-R-sulfoxide reductase with GAF domain